jgi:hypothetical protein
MRRRSRAAPGGQNLDSFLDILTNTVGVLVFVLLFVSLAAADASVLVRTPLRSETDKRGTVLEVRGDRITHVDTRTADSAFDRMIRSLPRINIYNYRSVAARVENFTTSTDHYRVDVVGSVLYGRIGLRYRVRSGDVGMDLRDLRGDSSAYLRMLDALDPEEDYLAFIVRPDGVAAFRAARDLAAKRGFQTGWEPFIAELDLVFSSRGRTLGVQ